jgi:hypothetical protein
MLAGAVVQHLSVADLAYLAGLLDGEGSICILKRVRNGRIRHWLEISIGNTDYEVLEWVRDTFGGHLSSNAQTNTEHSHKVWRWRANTQEAAGILRDVTPYVRIKRAQVALAIEFQDHFSGRDYRHTRSRVTEGELTWREAMREKLSLLNLRHRPRM